MEQVIYWIILGLYVGVLVLLVYFIIRYLRNRNIKQDVFQTQVIEILHHINATQHKHNHEVIECLDKIDEHTTD